jgi:hypothetical protein
MRVANGLGGRRGVAGLSSRCALQMDATTVAVWPVCAADARCARTGRPSPCGASAAVVGSVMRVQTDPTTVAVCPACEAAHSKLTRRPPPCAWAAEPMRVANGLGDPRRVAGLRSRCAFKTESADRRRLPVCGADARSKSTVHAEGHSSRKSSTSSIRARWWLYVRYSSQHIDRNILSSWALARSTRVDVRSRKAIRCGVGLASTRILRGWAGAPGRRRGA